MSVSYRELTYLNPHAFSDASRSMSKLVTKLATEYVQYKTGVQAPVKARDGWSGGGQPDAAVVVEVNGLAIDTMRLRAATGAVTFLYGNIGFTFAQQQLATLTRTVEADDMRITDTGTVVDDHDPNSAKRTKHQHHLQQILDFATTIDQTVAGSLNTSHEQPVVGLTNHPGLLEEARRDHENAVVDAEYAVRTLQELPSEAGKQLPADTMRSSLPDIDVYVPPGAAGSELLATMVLVGLTMDVLGIGAGIAGAPEATLVLGASGSLLAAAGASMIRLQTGAWPTVTTGSGTGMPADSPAGLDQLMQQAKRVERQADPNYHPPQKLSSRIGEDPS